MGRLEAIAFAVLVAITAVLAIVVVVLAVLVLTGHAPPPKCTPVWWGKGFFCIPRS